MSWAIQIEGGEGVCLRWVENASGRDRKCLRRGMLEEGGVQNVRNIMGYM